MSGGLRHGLQRSNRVVLKADCVVLLDRIVALTGVVLAPQLLVEISEMRMRLSPPPGVKAPIIRTGYTRPKR